MKKLIVLFVSLTAVFSFAKTEATTKKWTKPTRTVAQNIPQNSLAKVLTTLNKVGINPNKLSAQYLANNNCSPRVTKEDITSITETENTINFVGQFMCFPAKNDSPAVGIIDFNGKISHGQLTEFSLNGKLDSSD